MSTNRDDDRAWALRRLGSAAITIAAVFDIPLGVLGRQWWMIPVGVIAAYRWGGIWWRSYRDLSHG